MNAVCDRRKSSNSSSSSMFWIPYIFPLVWAENQILLLLFCLLFDVCACVSDMRAQVSAFRHINTLHVLCIWFRITSIHHHKYCFVFAHLSRKKHFRRKKDWLTLDAFYIYTQRSYFIIMFIYYSNNAFISNQNGRKTKPKSNHHFYFISPWQRESFDFSILFMPIQSNYGISHFINGQKWAMILALAERKKIMIHQSSIFISKNEYSLNQ